MFADLSITASSPWAAGAVALLGALAAALALWRRPAIPRLTYAASMAALALMALAAADLAWPRRPRQPVTVMVDLSPSTRTADYRDRTTLDRRIHELLGSTPFQIEFFADGMVRPNLDGPRLPDVPAERTRFVSEGSTKPILLFSDGRFPLIADAPPVYVVIDPGLEDVEDAAVSRLDVGDGQATASVRNAGGARQLKIDGTAPTTAPTGSIVVTRPVPAGASRIAAELTPGDAWPENDALAAVPPPPRRLERWWVRGRDANADATLPDGWRAIAPDELPVDPAAYLAASVIVLENVAASDLPERQQQRLAQYARDLGGGVMVLGGDRAFAAGGYEGSALDDLSPLSSYPPQPTNHWILLADASGSMGDAVAGATKWRFVSDAIVGLLPHLPPSDLVSVGSFAAATDWWAEARPAREVAAMSLPPSFANPHGPTNLQPALEAIARANVAARPVQLLVLSDFDTRITGADALTSLLKSHQVHLHLMAIGEGSALPALRTIAAATGGSVIAELDPTRWATSARALARAALPDLLQRRPIRVTFDQPQGLGSVPAQTWNRVWLKDRATGIGMGTGAAEGIALAARWNLGEGHVLAVAFDPPANVVERLASTMERPPHDPRFRVRIESGPDPRLTIDALEVGRYLNGQNLTVELGGAAARPIAQVAPGRYAMTLPAPRAPTLATIRAAGQPIARYAVAGRYAPEFDAVGNDHAAMARLAQRTGGQVIRPTVTAPLDLRFPRRPTALASPLSISAALLLGLGLLWWWRR